MSESSSDVTYTLNQYPEKLIVAQLGPGADVPAWAESSSVFAVIATATETTVVCAGRSVPAKVVKQGPFTAFAVADTLDFALTGVLHGLLDPIAEAGISIFSLSTYPTDWILVPTEKADEAAEAWRRRGHTVVPAPVVS
ncbi:ACT domain-containing protein [Nocardioides marmorisolisilvae]|uniref:ACT domain-containing protein n=1 Tax=Nocardioides marmorisolisilvae TaxID=1542737 RepID=UPI001617CFAD|nr:ACT domain-containing protein [Nocardioides marmorisolisilvae]